MTRTSYLVLSFTMEMGRRKQVVQVRQELRDETDLAVLARVD
jgi:hypothetical protein